MGVSLGNKYHSIDGGYSMMFQLRKMVAEQYDKDLGELYSKLLYANSPSEKFKLNESFNTLFRNDKFKEEDNDLFDFLFMPDCDGKITYRTCKKVYELIKNIDDCSIGYAGTSQTLNDFKEILKECYSKRMNLTWY